MQIITIINVELNDSDYLTWGKDRKELLNNAFLCSYSDRPYSFIFCSQYWFIVKQNPIVGSISFLSMETTVTIWHRKIKIRIESRDFTMHFCGHLWHLYKFQLIYSFILFYKTFSKTTSSTHQEIKIYGEIWQFWSWQFSCHVLDVVDDVAMVGVMLPWQLICPHSNCHSIMDSPRSSEMGRGVRLFSQSKCLTPRNFDIFSNQFLAILIG